MNKVFFLYIVLLIKNNMRDWLLMIFWRKNVGNSKVVGSVKIIVVDILREREDIVCWEV